MFRRSPRSDRAEPVSAETSREPGGAPAPLVVIDDATFMDATEGAITVVDFWAAWCGPCRSFAPVFAQAALDHAGRARFGTCDVEANPRTTGLLGIQSVPTLVVFGDDGSELTRVSGALPPRQLAALLESLLPHGA